MRREAKNMNDHYIEVEYEDKIIFKPKQRAMGHPDVIDTWQRSRGLWTDHPVFRGMTIKKVIDWLRGENCEV